MQVAVKESEKGKFSDGLNFTGIRVDSPGRGPEPVARVYGRRLVGECQIESPIDSFDDGVDRGDACLDIGIPGLIPGIQHNCDLG